MKPSLYYPYSLSNKLCQNYCNLTIFVCVIIEDGVDILLRYSLYIYPEHQLTAGLDCACFTT